MSFIKLYEKFVQEAHIYWLKKKLDDVLKLAEQRLGQNVPRGEGYADLSTLADGLITTHQLKYPAFKAETEAPAVLDLRKLMIPAEPVSLKKYLVPAGIGSVVVISGLGLFGALVTLSYEGWIHLLKWIL